MRRQPGIENLSRRPPPKYGSLGSSRTLFSNPAMRQTVVDFSAYAVVRTLVAVIQVLPTDMGDAICRWMAGVASHRLSIRRSTTKQNLKRAFPAATELQRSELTEAMWHSLLMMVCEIAWARRRLHRCNWSRHVSFDGNQMMLDKLLSPRPCVMVTGHFGNFEVGGHVMGLMGFPTLTIARKLDNRFLDSWLQGFRGAQGQHLVDKEGCAPVVERHLQNGGILSLLADQHAGEKGCWVDFMGTPASCHKALALFSLSSNAPMVVVATRRRNQTPMKFEIGMSGWVDPLSVPADPAAASVSTLTQWYNQRLSELVAGGVEQYWWLHRRWRTPPPRVQRRLAKANKVTKAA